MPVRAKGLFALFLFAALSVSARAADTTPPATARGPCRPAAPAAPSPAAIAAADKILDDHWPQAVDRDCCSRHDGGA